MTSAARKFFANEANLASGKKITIDPSHSDDSAIVQHFVRHYRKATIHQSVDDVNEINLIENIRNHLKLNQLSEAESIFNNIKIIDLSKEFQSEYLLELARLQLFKKDYLAAIETTSVALAKIEITPLTTVTLHQLRSDIYLTLNDLQQAEAEALAAVEKSKKFRLITSRYASLGFLAIIQNSLMKPLQSKQTIETLSAEVASIKNINTWLDRTLYLYRTLFRIALANENKSEAFKYLVISKTVAEITQNIVIYKKCETDFNQFSTAEFDQSQFVKTNNHYFWIPEVRLLGSFDNNKTVRFNEQSRRAQIIHLIFEGKLELEYIFETVWKMNYNKDKHSNLVRNHIFLIKKEWPGLISD